MPFYNAVVTRSAAGMLAAAALAHAQYSPTEPLRPDTILLSRIRYVMAENLAHLPNYTCTLTIERSLRRAKLKRFESLDLLRIEVALVSGKELYAWPGSSQFEEREISEMVPGGTIGTGDFGLHARSVFLSSVTAFTYLGPSKLDQAPVHRFAFHVPRNLSGYVMRVRPAQGIVGYRGVVHNNADNLDLLRMEIEVDDIPANLPIRSASNLIEYQRLAIGGSTFLLPKSSEMVITDFTGDENRNRTSFSNCRQYSGDSTLTFDEPSSLPSTPSGPNVTLNLPSGLEVDLKMTRIASQGRMAVGDAFEAEVTKAVRRKGQEHLPKGAKIQGRVALFVRLPGPDEYYLIGLRPESFLFANTTGRFDAVLELPLMHAFLSPGMRTRINSVQFPLGLERNAGYFVVSSERFQFPSGLTMVWRTLDSLGESRP